MPPVNLAASPFDVVVIGAGAAGLYCAGLAGQRGLRVLVIDHAARVAEKIRISGGGRCNFTNRDVTPANFLSANPHFCRSALARHTPGHFIELLQRHRIAFHEKHKGQLFCDGSSEQVIQTLLAECATGQVVRWQPCAVHAIRHGGAGFELDTACGAVGASQLVVACGGLSIPKIGATDFGLQVARQFGHQIVETRPALVPLTFALTDWAPFSALAGLSLSARVATGNAGARGLFEDGLLFTHRGLSGPAILQISSYCTPGTPLEIDLAPGHDLAAELIEAKRSSRRTLVNELAQRLPRRLAEIWIADHSGAHQPLPALRDRDFTAIAQQLHKWLLTPSGTEGYRKAEVMRGGVDTRQLNSTSMQSTLQPGLHFIGEVVDVTGWLGGYNFQWAWSSAAACAFALQPGRRAAH